VNSLSFNFADTLNTPVIVSDSSGKVVYKNHCATRCIKSPRRNSTINKHISKKIPTLKSPTGIIEIQGIINRDSIYRRAFVCNLEKDGEHFKVWIFSSFMQTVDIEDLEYFNLNKLEKCLMDGISSIESIDFCANRSSIERYDRIARPFFDAMKYLKPKEDPMGKFRVYNILKSIEKKTAELCAAYSARVEFVMGAVNPSNYYHLSFESFTAIYTNALLTLLKMADYSPVRVEFNQHVEFFDMTMTTIVKPLRSIPEKGTLLFEVAAGFPDEYFNILFLEQFALLNEYKIKYTSQKVADGVLLTVNFKTSLREKYLSVQDTCDFVIQLNFDTIEINLREYMDSIFKIL